MLAGWLATALYSVAMAADVTGTKADYTLTMSVGPELIRHAMAAAGVDGASADASGALPTLPPVALHGRTVWSGSRIRTDVFNAGDAFVSIQLEDVQRNLGWDVDLLEHTAQVHALKTGPAELVTGGQSGIGDGLMDYDSMLAQLKALKGTTYTELGAQTIGGYACHGVSFVIDLEPYRGEILAEAATSTDDAASLVGMPAMLDFLKTAQGEIWVSDDSKVTVRMKIALSDLVIDVERSNILPWKGPATALDVPSGYLIIDKDHPAFGMRPWVPLFPDDHLWGT